MSGGMSVTFGARPDSWRNLTVTQLAGELGVEPAAVDDVVIGYLRDHGGLDAYYTVVHDDGRGGFTDGTFTTSDGHTAGDVPLTEFGAELVRAILGTTR